MAYVGSALATEFATAETRQPRCSPRPRLKGRPERPHRRAKPTVAQKSNPPHATPSEEASPQPRCGQDRVRRTVSGEVSATDRCRTTPRVCSHRMFSWDFYFGVFFRFLAGVPGAWVCVCVCGVLRWCGCLCGSSCASVLLVLVLLSLVWRCLVGAWRGSVSGPAGRPVFLVVLQLVSQDTLGV